MVVEAESLFRDGGALVLFTVLLGVAYYGRGGHATGRSCPTEQARTGRKMPPAVAQAFTDFTQAMKVEDVVPTSVVKPGTTKYRPMKLPDDVIAKYAGSGQAAFEGLRRGEHNDIKNSRYAGLRIGKVAKS